MVFKSFRFRILIRIIIILITLFLIVLLSNSEEKYVSLSLLSLVLIAELVELFRFMDITNRKLRNFLESVRYSDFVSSFNSGKTLGPSFRELDKSFNDVMEAFRLAREEKEEHWLFLNTVVQHINVGIVSFESDGSIGHHNTRVGTHDRNLIGSKPSTQFDLSQLEWKRGFWNP